MESEIVTWSSALAEYRAVVDALEGCLQGIGEEGLDLSLRSDEWTIRQTVHHIVDGDDLWRVIIKAALGQPERVLSIQWYWDRTQQAWAETWAYRRRGLGAALTSLRANREHMAEMLLAVPESDERSATMRWPNGDQAELTVREMVEMQIRHVLCHIDDIRAIRKGRGL
jgi:uncharacterized damage-inducible protein DinB